MSPCLCHCWGWMGGKCVLWVRAWGGAVPEKLCVGGGGEGRGRAWWEPLSTNFRSPGQGRHPEAHLCSAHTTTAWPPTAQSLASAGPSHVGAASSYVTRSLCWAGDGGRGGAGRGDSDPDLRGSQAKGRGKQRAKDGDCGGRWAWRTQPCGRGAAKAQRHRGTENGHFGEMGSLGGLDRGGHGPGKALQVAWAFQPWPHGRAPGWLSMPAAWAPPAQSC